MLVEDEAAATAAPGDGVTEAQKAEAHEGGIGLEDVERLVAEVVQQFQDGQQQEALERAASFTVEAREKLGPKNPVFVNCLAVVAAVLDHMGAMDEADTLLLEAEELQEELDRKEHPEGAGHTDAPVNDAAVEAAESHQPASEQTTTAPSPDEQDVESCLASASSASDEEEGGVWGDAEQDFDYGSDEDDEDEHADALEAQAITRLTLEVNMLLQHEKLEEAAQLLSAAEQAIASTGDLSGVGKAAFHTLWAGILGAVGEEDQAQALYSEAILCLQTEALGPRSECPDMPTTTDASSKASSDSESSSELCIGPEDMQEERKSAELEPDKGERAREEDEKRPEEKSEKQQDEHEDAEESTKIVETEQAPQHEEVIAGKPMEGGAEAAIVPTLPPGTSEHGRRPGGVGACKRVGGGFVTPRPPPAASLPAHRRRRVQRKEAEEGEPKATEGLSLAEEGAEEEDEKQAEAKEEEKEEKQKQEEEKKEGEQEHEKTRTREDLEVNQKLMLEEDKKEAEEEQDVHRDGETGAKQVEVADEEVEEQTPEKELAKVKSAMTCADHLVGVMSFERAADELEAVLKMLSQPAAHHRHSDVHVDCLVKYARILWWNSDPEGAIDALRAADEALDAREGDSHDVKLRRVDIWLQLGQVCRQWDDLEAAEEHLSNAVSALMELVQAHSSVVRDNRPVQDWLQDAQASLAQVCVQRKDFSRAEELYRKAFASEIRHRAAACGAAAMKSEPSLPA